MNSKLGFGVRSCCISNANGFNILFRFILLHFFLIFFTLKSFKLDGFLEHVQRSFELILRPFYCRSLFLHLAKRHQRIATQTFWSCSIIIFFGFCDWVQVQRNTISSRSLRVRILFKIILILWFIFYKFLYKFLKECLTNYQISRLKEKLNYL